MTTNLRVIPEGWSRVFVGYATMGDKFWDATYAAWLPVIAGGPYFQAPVRAQETPTIIRKDENV
jgi:hypothetical protein